MTRRLGISRRDLLRVGCLAPFGLAMGDWLAARASAAGRSVPATSCILLWLDGGPSHLETFDLKPTAPAEVRGPFRPIQTAVPGTILCEHMPRLATLTDQFSIIRSMTSPLGEHGLAHHYLLTGYPPSPVLQYPSYGSVVSHFHGGENELPNYVAMPEARGPAGAGFLGTAAEPFVLGGDPSRPDFQVRDLGGPASLDAARLQRRREFLDQFGRNSGPLKRSEDWGHDPFDQAFRLATSPQAQRAFALQEESAATRERYGPRAFGQSCLLARRLVERGVPFVTVQQSGWDTHEGLVLQLRDGYSGAKVGVGLIPTLDQALAALLTDLQERGMLAQTLVVVMGEFGRTPKINPRGGRDHWPRVFSVVLAGGGIPGGRVIGASDRMGESPDEHPVSPADLARTIYRQLGVDPAALLTTPDGRPIAVNQGGQEIAALL